MLQDFRSAPEADSGIIAASVTMGQFLTTATQQTALFDDVVGDGE